MQAVRCEACGMKALVAASQCPHCGHLLELRDSFGELLPLTHCPTCECDYLTRDGMCKWCGTTPQPRRVDAGMLWKGVGALAFVGMAIGVWATRSGPADRARDRAPNDSSRTRVFVPIVDDTPDVVATIPIDVPRDTPLVMATPIVMEPAYVAPPTSDPVATETMPPTAVSRTEVAGPPAPMAVAPAPVRAARAPARVGTARWRSVVARDWVTVRAAPRHGARLLGSLGPDTRLQLGESRAGWVRVRIRGLTGWVHEARLSTRTPRAGTLARR